MTQRRVELIKRHETAAFNMVVEVLRELSASRQVVQKVKSQVKKWGLKSWWKGKRNKLLTNEVSLSKLRAVTRKAWIS